MKFNEVVYPSVVNYKDVQLDTVHNTIQQEEAKIIANNLPSFEVGRELLIAECLEGAEKEDHYRYLIDRFEGMIMRYKKRINE